MAIRGSAGHSTSNMLVRTVNDKKEQKRIQNRIAQRTYRQNQKQRVQALEAAVRASCDMGLISPPPTTIHVSDHRNNSSTAGATLMSQDASAAFDDSRLWLVDNQDMNLDWNETSPPPPPPPTSSAGRAALHLAACNGNEPMTRLLLDSGADVNRQDSSGFTPLHLAAEAGHDAIVKMLLSRSADPNALDLMGQTALLSAVKAGNESTARMLLEDTSTDVNARDATGQAAMHAAVEAGSEALVLLLLSHGANVNA